MNKKILAKTQEKLLELGIERIIIADDEFANIAAALPFAETLPEIEFEFYHRGDLVVAQIPERYQEIGLILTDRQMETKDAGLDVLETAWRYRIPTFVCSGGYEHGNKPLVRIFPGNYQTPEGMTKDKLETWENIIDYVISEANKPASIMRGLVNVRRTGFEGPEDSLAKDIRETAKMCFDDIP